MSGAADKLRITGCTKSFGAKKVLDNVSFEVRDGEFLSILGPSGCGKTTLLRILTGLEKADSGTITKDGKDITSVSPDKRGMGIVFQNYALFENMSVLKNVAYPLRFHREFRGHEREAAEEILRTVGMGEHLSMYPAQLSGGQQQRVAIARALVLRPDVILFDEPMAALDAENRIVLRDEIKKLQKEFSSTVIYVTHDQEEAFSLSDRIMVMDGGHICQTGTPSELLNAPADEFVSRFVGSNIRRHYADLRRYAESVEAGA